MSAEELSAPTIKPRQARETSMRFPGRFFTRYFVSQRNKSMAAGNGTLSEIKNQRRLGRELLQGLKGQMGHY